VDKRRVPLHGAWGGSGAVVKLDKQMSLAVRGRPYGPDTDTKITRRGGEGGDEVALDGGERGESSLGGTDSPGGAEREMTANKTRPP